MPQNIDFRFQQVSRSVTFKNIVKTYHLNEKSVLDIGCSYGEFLAHFGAGSTGITITPDEVTYATHRGLDVRYGNVESDEFVLKETYDVIFANNIFEHLYSPHHFLCKIKKYLKPNGLLILGVPCIPKIVSLVHFSKFRGSLAGAHINFFTRYTLAQTVLRGGWNIQAVRGFHFANPVVDHFLDPIYPHVYVVAQAVPGFTYPEKRIKELAGYTNITV